ncbi:hypothetical protein ABK040_012053 [Willaertia magna]
MHYFKTVVGNKSISFPQDQQIKLIKSGNGFIFIVNNIGELFLYDVLQFLKYRTSKPIYCDKFLKINEINNVKLLACGYEHGIIINNYNEIFIFGKYPLDGLQNLENNFFKKVINVSPNDEIKIVTCGFDNTFIVTKNNILYVTGVNMCGQLGFDSLEKTVKSFTKVDTLQYFNIIDVQCGDDHTLILDDLGNVYGSGNNSNDELGLNNNESENNIMEETDKYKLLQFTKLNIPFKVRKISALAQGSILLSINGEVYISGNIYNNHTTFKKAIMPTADIKIENIYSTFINSNIYLFSNNNKCYHLYIKEGHRFKELNCTSNNSDDGNSSIEIFKCLLPCYFADDVFMLMSDYFVNENMLVDCKAITHFKLKLRKCNLQNQVSDITFLL